MGEGAGADAGTGNNGGNGGKKPNGLSGVRSENSIRLYAWEPGNALAIFELEALRQ